MCHVAQAPWNFVVSDVASSVRERLVYGGGTALPALCTCNGGAQSATSASPCVVSWLPLHSTYPSQCSSFNESDPHPAQEGLGGDPHRSYHSHGPSPARWRTPDRIQVKMHARRSRRTWLSRGCPEGVVGCGIDNAMQRWKRDSLGSILLIPFVIQQAYVLGP